MQAPVEFFEGLYVPVTKSFSLIPYTFNKKQPVVGMMKDNIEKYELDKKIVESPDGLYLVSTEIYAHEDPNKDMATIFKRLLMEYLLPHEVAFIKNIPVEYFREYLDMPRTRWLPENLEPEPALYFETVERSKYRIHYYYALWIDVDEFYYVFGGFRLMNSFNDTKEGIFLCAYLHETLGDGYEEKINHKVSKRIREIFKTGRDALNEIDVRFRDLAESRACLRAVELTAQ